MQKEVYKDENIFISTADGVHKKTGNTKDVLENVSVV